MITLDVTDQPEMTGDSLGKLVTQLSYPDYILSTEKQWNEYHDSLPEFVRIQYRENGYYGLRFIEGTMRIVPYIKDFSLYPGYSKVITFRGIPIVQVITNNDY